MKTLYFFLIFCLSATVFNAQLTMLRQWHEPVAGDQTGVRAFDSTGVIPKNTGSAQVWDFSTLVINSTGPTASSFVAPSTVPASSMYPGSTVVEAKNGEYTYFKSGTGPDVFEGLGYQSSLATVNYSNDAMTVFAWPISFGTNFNDTYSGGISGLFNGNLTGTLQTVASGEGTLVLPGSDKYSDVLQLKSVQSATIANNTGTIANLSYSYFHSTQKFPLLSVNYFRLTTPTSSIFTYSVFVNKLVAVGINDQNFNDQFTIYPNPSKGAFSVKLTNEKSQVCIVSIIDGKGQVVRRTEITNTEINEEISTAGFPAGIYLVKTQLGNQTSTKKMILE